MANYPIPPWLTNLPDAVSAYSHGLQIGASIGEAQSRQQLAQEQMLREQQKDAVQTEIEKQKFQLQADAAAKRYAAEQKFQQLISSGVDPSQAILQVPALGNELTPMVSLLKGQQMTPYQTQEIALRQQELEQRKKAPGTVHAAGGGLYRQNPDGTVTELVSPKEKVTKAHYTFTKSNGDKITGTIDDPEIAALVEADKAAKAKKAAEDAAPSFLSKFFGGGSAAPPAPAQAKPSNIKSVRRIDQQQPSDQEEQDMSELLDTGE